MHKNIIQYLRKFVELNDREAAVFNKFIETKSCKKKELILVLEEKKVCKHLNFVEKGCLRMYFIHKKGVEQITQFALDGWWISDYQSLINNAPSDYYI